jgi:transcriptional regulator of acetoin/glycerol metabolism
MLCRIGYPRLAIDPRTLAVLRRHPLPGNLHELRRILEHASLSCVGGVILPEHLPEEVGARE